MNGFVPYPIQFDNAESDLHNKITFETLDELLNIENVKQFKHIITGFSHYAKNENRLMAVYHDGLFTAVIGYVDNPEQLDLPILRPIVINYSRI